MTTTMTVDWIPAMDLLHVVLGFHVEVRKLLWREVVLGMFSPDWISEYKFAVTFPGYVMRKLHPFIIFPVNSYNISPSLPFDQLSMKSFYLRTISSIGTTPFLSPLIHLWP